ncbi:MAG: hypothetical protein JWO37_3288 [Acidimicrobiales bacterium]|jgi:hypothetical protein|nr:hypothetical protein [Acidimicrobiales bacterium]
MSQPTGYRRRIRLVGSDGRVVGDLEDDFHHFRVAIDHDGERVTGISGEGVRFPWSTCPLAAEALLPITGMALSTRSTAVGDATAARDNCTHMFDLAGLAVAHAARGATTRQYDIFIPDGVPPDGMATLALDGSPVLAWEVDMNQVLGPPPFAGVPLRAGFLAWAEANLDADAAEAAIVLRRALHIAHGRIKDLDGHDTADELFPMMSGSCWTFTPGRAEVAMRMKGSTRDFSASPDDLCR